jgi:hypothetical protein
MNFHVVYEGPNEVWQASRLKAWLIENKHDYFLTQVSTGFEIGKLNDASEFVVSTKLWDAQGNAIVHTWEQPGNPDALRIFKQMSYSMNRIGLNRFNREIDTGVEYDAVVYWNNYLGDEIELDTITQLEKNDILTNASENQVDYHFFITRPHNFDRISLLWKKPNADVIRLVTVTKIYNPKFNSNKVAWYSWLRTLNMKIIKL